MSRECGDCKVCCWAPEVVGVTTPGSWCQHCDPKAALGCAIYADRPDACAAFECLYIKEPGIVPDALFPKTSRIMATALESKKIMIWETIPGASLKRQVSDWILDLRAKGYEVVIGNPTRPDQVRVVE